MATTVTTRTGKKRVLLNPAEKGRKAAIELKEGYKRTNYDTYKTDSYGDPIPLNATERAYRSGYLDARKDSAKCWKAKQKKKSKK